MPLVRQELSFLSKPDAPPVWAAIEAARRSRLSTFCSALLIKIGHADIGKYPCPRKFTFPLVR